jgi:hypothetical protein
MGLKFSNLADTKLRNTGSGEESEGRHARGLYLFLRPHRGYPTAIDRPPQGNKKSGCAWGNGKWGM